MQRVISCILCILILGLTFSTIKPIETYAYDTIEGLPDTGNSAETSKYKNMVGDFSDRRTQPEHRRWTQGCKWGGGICGCNSTRQATRCWSKMAIGKGASCQRIGCVTVSMAIMLAESGGISDANFTPDEWIQWGYSNGLWSGDIMLWTPIAKYCPNAKAVSYGIDGTVKIKNPVADVEALLDKGYYMTGWVRSGHGHTVYVLGTAINPKTNEKDVVICDPGCRNNTMYLKELCAERDYPGLLEVCTFSISGCSNFMTTNGFTGGTSSSGLTQQDMEMTFGKGTFEDDILVSVREIVYNLIDVNEADLSHFQDIKAELKVANLKQTWSKLNVGVRVLGIILLLYIILFGFAYMIDYSSIGEISFLRIISFGNVQAVHNKEDAELSDNTHTTYMDLKKFIMLMVFGIIISSLFIGADTLMQWILAVYYKVSK